MQKLPEAPDRKKGDRCAKKATVFAKEGNLFSFSSGWRSDNLKLSCCKWKAPRVCFYAARWLTFPLVATVSFTNNPRLKTPNNRLVKTAIKTSYNGLSKLQLKTTNN